MNLDKLRAYHLDPQVLADQEFYLVYVDQFLGWINFEGWRRSKLLEQTNPIPKPGPLDVQSSDYNGSDQSMFTNLRTIAYALVHNLLIRS
jgi:hypothetical protein